MEPRRDSILDLPITSRRAFVQQVPPSPFRLLRSAGSSVECAPDLPRYGRGNDKRMTRPTHEGPPDLGSLPSGIGTETSPEPLDGDGPGVEGRSWQTGGRQTKPLGELVVFTHGLGEGRGGVLPHDPRSGVDGTSAAELASGRIQRHARACRPPAGWPGGPCACSSSRRPSQARTRS